MRELPACRRSRGPFCRRRRRTVWVVTLETARRRGFGSAVTLAALDIARERGARTAVLQASSDGAQLYRNVGFEDVGTYAEYSIGSG
ncbi:GNAT family N-acetyltransferase [Rhodococcus sp. 1.20]